MYRSLVEFLCNLSRHVREALTGNLDIHVEGHAQTSSTDSEEEIFLFGPFDNGKPQNVCAVQ